MDSWMCETKVFWIPPEHVKNLDILGSLTHEKLAYLQEKFGHPVAV